MKIEVKNGIAYLYPDTGKRLKLLNGTDTYSVVILAKDDTEDNYEEVDSLWEPDLPESDTENVPEVPAITPDENGKITYEDAQKLVDTIKEMQSRMVDMQESNTMLTECVLEMSEVVYDAEIDIQVIIWKGVRNDDGYVMGTADYDR